MAKYEAAESREVVEEMLSGLREWVEFDRPVKVDDIVLFYSSTPQRAVDDRSEKKPIIAVVHISKVETRPAGKKTRYIIYWDNMMRGQWDGAY